MPLQHNLRELELAFCKRHKLRQDMKNLFVLWKEIKIDYYHKMLEPLQGLLLADQLMLSLIHI